MTTGLIVAGVVLGGLLIVFIVLGLLLKRIRAARMADVETTLAGERILFRDDFANNFGVESLGVTQVRGNGILSVTERGIHFLMLVPRREVAIPAEAITAVERVRGHLGKTVGRQILKVSFTNAEGQPDSVAWFLRRLDEGEAAVQALQRQAKT